MSLTKSVICPVLIGRADDLEAINQLTAQAAQGQGQIVLISGEAGIGKSRLVLEAVQHARGLGMQILKGNCFETDRTLPYAPLLDLLRNFYAEHVEDDLSAYFGSTSNELIKIFPELAEAHIETVPTPTLESEQEKYRLFQALTQFLIAQANDPLLIVIEDLHWCDDTSLEFLLRFTRRLEHQSILLLLIYRSEEANLALTHFLAELDRQRLAAELILSRLSPAEVDAMLRAIFELNRPIRPEFMNVLYPLTEGNPFFIEEILKSLIMTGGIFYADGTWDRKPIEELNIPRSVQDAVRRRAEQLSADAKGVLSLAAVIGQRFAFSLLRDLTNWNEERLLRLIKELMAVQLIVEESGDRFAFRHALTREAIYSQIMERERQAMHQKIGESIEQLNRNSLDEQSANLAYHFYQANAWQKAMEYSERAGQRALTLYAPRAAIEHFTHAMDAARHRSISPPIQFYRARGSAYETLGDFEDARADYENALTKAQASGDPVQEWHSLLDLGSLWAGRDYSRTGEYYQHAYEVAPAINDPKMLAHTLNRLGNWYVNMENTAEGLRCHAEALRLFQERGDPQGLAEALDLLGIANVMHGDLVQSEAYYNQAVEIFRQLDRREHLASSLASKLLNNAHLQSGMAVLAKSNRKDALHGGEEALLIARDIGWRSGEAYALIILGNFHTNKGEYSKAFELAKASLSVAEEIEHSQWIAYSHCGLGALYFDILAWTQAREHLEHALTLASQIGSRWWITNATGFLALTYIAENQYESAMRVLGAALNTPIDFSPQEETAIHALTLGQRLCWYACAQLAFTRGNPEFALQIIDQLLDSSANMTNEGTIPRLAILRGEALTALHRTEQAEEALLAARRVAEEENEMPYLWRIHAALGRLYQLQSRREDALSAFTAAQAIIAELSAQIPDEGLRAEFSKRASALLPGSQRLSPRRATKMDFGGLTAREREIAALIAQGKSNPEIAKRLVISERTVTTHVSHILAKLGFSSRTQVASWATEKKLGGPPAT